MADAPIDYDALEPTYLGPSWQRDGDGKLILPEPNRTLGWDILGWCGEYLNNFDGTPGLRLTAEQARLILWWYAIDDDGEFVYTRGVIQRLKGAGKDPLLAVIALVEWLGPSRFGGWAEDGSPIAVPVKNAWVQIAAVSRDQTKNTLTLFPTLISENLKTTYSILPGLELMRALGGTARLEAVTSSFRSLEGGRATFQMLNETQHWVAGNQGHRMYETVNGNATKMNSRFLAITNAYLPGEDSVGERMRIAYTGILEGRLPDIGFMYDSIEAHPATPLTPDALRVVLPKIRGDATWLNVENIIKSVLDSTISPARSRRMFLNQVVADADALYEESDWDSLRVEDHLRPGDKIVLGFDGGRSDDSTALVAIRASDGLTQALLVEERPNEVGARDKDAPKWEVNRAKVDSAVHAAFATYEVVGFYADVALWESYVSDWGATYGHKLLARGGGNVNPIWWDMRGSLKRTTIAHELLVQTILDGKLKHGGERATELNRTLRRHLLNARRRQNNYGVSFGKESADSPLKVDAYAALMLAHTALNDYRQKASAAPTQARRSWLF